jgi:hypothetical protein
MSEIEELLDRYGEETAHAWDDLTPSYYSAKAGGEAQSIRQEIVALYDTQAARIQALEGQLDDHANTLKHALDGRTDEQHCGCCAPLRARVAELEEACGSLLGFELFDRYDAREQWQSNELIEALEAMRGAADDPESRE